MGKIITSFIMPHPPIIIPEVGNGKEQEAKITLNAIDELLLKIKSIDKKIDTIILTSPHAPSFSDYIYISEDKFLNGDLKDFGHSEIKLEFENDLELLNKIKKNASLSGFIAGDLDVRQLSQFGLKKGLDHGALVPLYFVKKALPHVKLIHISSPAFSNTELYEFGMLIRESVEESDSNCIFIASGDLSHKYSLESPYGFSQKGFEFDKTFIKHLSSGNIPAILRYSPEFCSDAAECGLKSFIMMFGANDGFKLETTLFSHEGPFGIGYAVAELKPIEEIEKGCILNQLNADFIDDAKKKRESNDIYVEIARITLEAYIKNGITLKLKDISEYLNIPKNLLIEKSGVFVSLKKRGQLRGCIGTISPTTQSVAEEIMQNAISSGTQDHRFNTVEKRELDELVYSVDVLGKAEKIESVSSLDPKKYGVIITSGNRRGLLLPNLEGVDTVEEQISITLKKADISPTETYKLERFEVIRHK